jgi:hypothetical protein
MIPEVQRGLRYDDPELNITWPLAVSEISERDLQLPFWADHLEEAAKERELHPSFLHDHS